MFVRVKGRAVPLVLLVISGLWMAAVVLPLLYSLCFPNPDIQQIVRAFEGRETLRAELAPLGEATRSSGRLNRAIQVAAYWGVSAEYKHGESHKTETTTLSYLAWFEKRSRPTILVVTRAEVDSARIHFEINEDSPLGMLRFYLVPASVLTASLCWFLMKRSDGTNLHADAKHGSIAGAEARPSSGRGVA